MKYDSWNKRITVISLLYILWFTAAKNITFSFDKNLSVLSEGNTCGASKYGRRYILIFLGIKKLYSSDLFIVIKTHSECRH